MATCWRMGKIGVDDYGWREGDEDKPWHAAS